MDAEVHVTGAGGKRTVAIKDFFTGSGETVLEPDELVTEIHIPPMKGKTVFLKLGRRKAMTLSVVNVAVHLDAITLPKGRRDAQGQSSRRGPD
jgi:CO/xanthine dehydrogenase FAD-binding subunit